MTLGGAQIILGLTCAGVTFGISLRQGKFNYEDFGHCTGAFTAGFNIPIAVFLCSYYFIDDPPLAQTKLHDVAKYISLAGLSLFFLATISLIAVIQNAWKKSAIAPPG
jgi:hypothetical protein